MESMVTTVHNKTKDQANLNIQAILENISDAIKKENETVVAVDYDVINRINELYNENFDRFCKVLFNIVSRYKDWKDILSCIKELSKTYKFDEINKFFTCLIKDNEFENIVKEIKNNSNKNIINFISLIIIIGYMCFCVLLATKNIGFTIDSAILGLWFSFYYKDHLESKNYEDFKSKFKEVLEKLREGV